MKRQIITLLTLLVVLNGCVTKREMPVGLGNSMDEYPKSPCACSPAFYDSGIWVS